MSNLRLRAIVLLLLLISPCGPTFRTQIKDTGALSSLMATWNHNDTGNGTRNATSNGSESAIGDYLKIAEGNTSTYQGAYLRALQAISALPVLTVYTLPNFWRDIKSDQIAHIKGFGGGMNIRLCENHALSLLNGFKLVIWDGDGYDEKGFTALLPKFLRQNPESRVLAFKLVNENMEFLDSWKTQAEFYPGRLAVVLVDVENDLKDFKLDLKIGPQVAEDVNRLPEQFPDWGKDYFKLGRFAILWSGAKYVLSIGGGGVARHEAEACWQNKDTQGKVRWDVFAISRGKKEEFLSLVDWANEKKRTNVNLLKDHRYDPNYELSAVGKLK